MPGNNSSEPKFEQQASVRYKVHHHHTCVIGLPRTATLTFAEFSKLDRDISRGIFLVSKNQFECFQQTVTAVRFHEKFDWFQCEQKDGLIEVNHFLTCYLLWF